MPVNDNSETTTTQQSDEIYLFLLDILEKQLDELLADKLIKQKTGVPFIDFQNDPPQVVSIKKVINAIYYTEEALKNYNNLGLANAVYKGPKALYQVYKSLSALDDATPGVREVIIQNYHVIEPLYSKAYNIVEESGWMDKFIELDKTEKVSKVVGEGISLLGSDVEKWNDTNPLIATFGKIAQLMQSMAVVQDKDTTEKDKTKQVELIRSILDDLDNNAFISQLSISDFEDAKAVQDLLTWFKDIQEDGFVFTKNSIEQYISKANTFLPKLIMLADQLERQNYLKPGLLSKELCSKADYLAKEMNQLLDSDSTYQITQRVHTMASLLSLREQQIDEAETKSVQTIMTVEEQRDAIAKFFWILDNYKGKTFSEMIESDRDILRGVYPKVQMLIAHADLKLENSLTAALNTRGPEKIDDTPKTWWQKATSGIGYMASFAYDYEINRLLATRPFINKTIDTQINTEQFKIMIAEKSRDNVQLTQEVVQEPSKKQPSLEERTAKRIAAIKNNLKEQVREEVAIPDHFEPVQIVQLTNLLGTLTYIQTLKLSEKVKESREALTTLVRRHIAKEKESSLSTPHVVIDESAEMHEQIRKVEHDLEQLEKKLTSFESVNLRRWGLTVRVQTYTGVASAADDLRLSILALSPDTQKILAPILKQVRSLGATLSNNDYRALDVSAVEHLKGEAITLPKESVKKQPIEPSIVVEETRIETVIETHKTTVEQGPDPLVNTVTPAVNTATPVVNTVTPVVNKTTQIEQPETSSKPTIKIDYVKKITEAREALLDKYKSTLSEPLAFSLLEQQKEGVPFINIENDAPQIAALKKMINSLYYAEAAIKIWREIDTSTSFRKLAAAHQGLAALSQLYKSLQLFTEVSSEGQNLIHENYDLIKPVISCAQDMIGEGQWAGQFKGMEWVKTIGSTIGQIVASVQSPPEEQTQTASLISLLSELPAVMNNMANLAGANEEVPANSLRISQERIDAISKVLELLFEENASLLNIFKGPQAILGLIELNKKFQKETTNLQEAIIRYYQQWLKDRYPDLLVMLDEIETRHYLKPGTLSGPIILEVDKLNDKLNEVIESKPPTSKLKLIELSSDLAPIRKMNLDVKKTEYWNESFQYEDQLASALLFFETLRKYSGKSFADITSEDKVVLRKNFAHIQLAIANNNLDLTNECVVALNQLETVDPKQWVGVKVSIEQILKQEKAVQNYITQKFNAVLLKIKVIDNAVEHIRFSAGKSFKFTSEEPSAHDLRQNYLLAQGNKPQIEPGELKPITPTSLSNVRGNLVFIQELKVSATVADMREKFSQVTKDRFSRLVQGYLKKTEGQKEHVIYENDPKIVRQVKGIENALYHLEEAFKYFESIHKSDKLVVQARALLEIQQEAAQLKDILEKLTPELKEHYGPIAIKMLDLSKKILNIDYNKEDLQDFATVLASTKKELLKRKTPRKVEAERVFHPYSSPESPTNPNESASAKAKRLGVKYLYLASPTLEETRKYLRSRYHDAFGEQPSIIRNYTRRQLSDEELMRGEISRLTEILQQHYGFNLTTVGLIVDVINQIQRVGTQTSEVVGMANKLVTNDYVKIKENAYRDFIFKISQEEDYLCLKPGTLVGPAMSIINELFLSAALEIDMSFDKKLSLLDEKRFLSVLIAETKKEITALKTEEGIEPNNKERAFEIKVKEDKLAFLNEQLELFAEKDFDNTKSVLLDIQFKVYLRDQLKGTTIKKPILDEYEKIVQDHYFANKKDFLAASDSADALYKSMQDFEKEHVGDYLIVHEALCILQRFATKLPSHNQDLKDYIATINKELTDDSLLIGDRVTKIQSLPKDKEFLDKLSTADNGTGFLISIVQFLVRVASSIIDSIVTGKNIVYVYNQKKIEDLMHNIEDTLKSQNVVTVEDNVDERIVASQGEQATETLVANKQIDSDEIDIDIEDEEGRQRSWGVS